MIRLATKDDIDAISNIMNDGIAYLAEQNINQWQNGYPNESDIIADIEAKQGYVYVNQGEIQGYYFLSFEIEQTYLQIFQGEWLMSEPYGTIHRFAVKSDCRQKGVANKMMSAAGAEAIRRGCNLRIDTHEDNKTMQRLIIKKGFVYCGKILIATGEERLAFEILL